MKWLASFAATLSRLVGINSRGRATSAQTRDGYGPAPIISPTPKPDGPSTSTQILIAHRAMKQCNRKASLVSIYEAKHGILSRGVK